jgi:hypothetical protein
MSNPNLSFSQAIPATQNAIANASNPGVSPPSYLQPQYWLYYRRMGCNVVAAPILIPLIDDVTQDLSNPSNATIATIGPPLWNVLDPNFKQPNNYGAAPNFPAPEVPPAPSSPLWVGSGMDASVRVGITPENQFPTNEGFPPPASAFPPPRPFPEPTDPRAPAGQGPFPPNPPFPRKALL